MTTEPVPRSGTEPDIATRPRPAPENVSRHYWEAAARGELLVQRCPACSTRQFYPRALCGACGATPEWERCSGRGTVYTFTVIRQNHAAPFADALPYVVAMIELEEGPRILSNVTDVEPADVHIGMAVQVWFAEVEPELAFPMFRPTLATTPT